MNFFVNRAMGLGNSGVEHAEFYRAKRFDQAQLPYRFVFTELVRELHEAMDKWNLKNDQVINMWEYFVFGGDYFTQGVPKRYERKEDTVIDSTDTHRKKETVTTGGMRLVEHFIKYPDPKDEGMLLVSTSRIELFNENTGERRVMYETLEDPHRGTVLANIHLFNEQGRHMFFRNEVQLQRYFFEQLDQAYDHNNNYIVDRGEASEAALFDRELPGLKIIEVMHADHLSDRDDPKKPLWNNYYEYALTHMDRVDRMITATKLQRDDLLVDFPNGQNQIVAIPVGGVSDHVEEINVDRDMQSPIKFISISRLASEKHIDLIVQAVAKVHDEGTPVALDIYGLGEEHNKIKKTIEESNAQDYIKLMGLTDHADQVYPNYDAFISASFSEGFGLTYIEALNAALPVITFNARFGALELVHDGINGFLETFKREDDEFNVNQLVDGIHKLINSDYQKLRANTKKSVEDYQDHVIAQQWKELINAL